MSRTQLSLFLDKLSFIVLIAYALTFIFDLKINLLKISFLLSLLSIIIVKPKWSVQSPIIYLLIIFVGLTLIPILINPSASFLEYKSRFLSPLLGLFLVFTLNMTKTRLFFIILSFTSILTLNSIDVIIEFMSNNLRPTGFSNAHYMFLAICNTLIQPIILAFIIVSYKTSKIPRFLAYLLSSTLIINIPAIIFENTRIVYISLFFSFLLIIYFLINNKIKATILCVALLLYSLAIFQISPNSSERFESIPQITYTNQSNYERLLMWQSAVNMFKDYPLSGVGIGNYYDYYLTEYRSPLSRETQGHPHNTFLFFLSEMGIFGGLSYFFIFLFLGYHALSTYKKTKSISAIIFLAVLISFFIHSQTDCIFSSIGFKQLSYMFWFLTGIYFWLNNSIKKL